MRSYIAALTLAVVILGGCTPPPPAPEGLDEAARFVFREFYSDDATVGAGLTGLMNWYDDEGYTLEGQGASIDEDTEEEGVQPASAFTLEDLDWDDLARIPVPDDDRLLEDANGIVSISEMDCRWEHAESLLVRPDQYRVFEGDFDTYDRTYLTSRSDYEGARESLDFTPVIQALPDVHASDYEHGDLASSIMLTTSHVSSTELGVTLEYDLFLHFRHGVYEVQGEQLPVWMILSWLREPASGQNGANVFEQSYGIEVNYGVGDNTLRIFANWAYVESHLAGPDAPIWSTGAVNKSRNAAERLSDICSGAIEVEPEQ